MLRNTFLLGSVARSFPLLGMATMLFGTGINAAQAARIGDPSPPGGVSAQTVTITPTADANTLVETVLGTGVGVSNLTFVGGTGNPFSAGTFTNGLSAGIGLDEGILLTSGDVTLAPGPNTADNATGFIGTPGDPDLDALIPGFSTQDATILEFDLTTTTGEIFIEYVFASEEYNEFVGSSFNDVFGFFLDGTNLALIPGTNTPVAINNVNNGVNSQFYNDNDPSDLGIPTPFDIQYDGFTDVFVASATGLTIGQTYTLKLAIADAGDTILDSGVFIRGITVDPPEPNTPEPATVVGLAALGALGATLKRKKAKN